MKASIPTLLILGLISGCNSLNNTAQFTETTATKPDLTETIRTYVEKKGSNLEETNYRSFEIDLNGDNIKDALVLFQGIGWCGSGGCSMAIFQGTEQDYSLISDITLVKEPVIVSETFTKGWRDIIVHVSGGGIIDAQDVALKFDGSSYPSNPSLEEPILPEQTIDGVKVVFASSYDSEEGEVSLSKSRNNLQAFNEKSASISTLYPQNMNSNSTCSHEGCGYSFTFNQQKNSLDTAEITIFIPSGVNSVKEFESFAGNRSLLDDPNSEMIDRETISEIVKKFDWIEKVTTYSNDSKTIYYRLLGEKSDRAIEVVLSYPEGVSDNYFNSIEPILENLEIKNQ